MKYAFIVSNRKLSTAVHFLLVLTLVKVSCLESALAQGLDREISAKWEQAEGSLKIKNLNEANQFINELESLKLKAGYTELPEQSEKLLEMSRNALASGDKPSAQYLARKALEFSPDAPDLLIRNSDHLIAVGLYGQIDIFFAISKAALHRYDFIFQMLIKTIYPVLWAATISFLITAFILFISNCHNMLFRLERYLPSVFKKFTACFMLSAFLIIPMLGGPLICIAAYVLLIYCLLPSHRRLGLSGAICLILWALLIPIRENMSLWLNRQEVKGLLRTASGVYNSSDMTNLEKINLGRNPDSLSKFSYAKVLRRQGKFDQAEAQLTQLYKILPEKSIIDREAGILKFLKSDTPSADAIYKEQLSENENNAAFFYNYSKFTFDMLDTETSREYFDKASKLDYELIDPLKRNEEKLGLNSPVSFAEEYLPLKYIFESAMQPNNLTKGNSDIVTARLLPYVSLMQLLWVSAVLILLFMAVKPQLPVKKESARKNPPYKPFSAAIRLFSVLPGGSTIIAGHSAAGFFLLFIITLLTLPFLNWPSEFSAVLSGLYGLELYYVYAYCFLIAALCYIGFAAYEREQV